jgi:kojibiose phosphorylase
MSTEGKWTLQEMGFDPSNLHHQETIFTIGNGYLATRGGFEEGYPEESQSTLIHGVFDDVPLVFTELANAPDWTDLEIRIGRECFSLASGEILAYQRMLDLRSAILTRQVRWRSPHNQVVELRFERFASLADPHLLFLRASITPFENVGKIEARACLPGSQDTLGVRHWDHLNQHTGNRSAWLHLRTHATRIELAMAERLTIRGAGNDGEQTGWDVSNHPTLTARWSGEAGKTVTVEKVVSIFTSRDTVNPVRAAVDCLESLPEDCWETMLTKHKDAWDQEWETSDVIIEGDDEAQLAIRFNIYQLLIAAPRQDERVSIGAKTLSGFGYRGHAFWDTEIFMLPFFTFTAPAAARNLLNYRYHNLPGARQKANRNGYEGAQFPWESAAAGVEVTPTWLPHFSDPTKLVRIWTGDIEIHISADIAYAAYQYWQATGDDEWMIEKGAELILDTAKFWASRAEWNAETGCYEYNDVVGPDEYHDHVDNNFYTNRLAQWNLQTALDILAWLRVHAPQKAEELVISLEITPQRLGHWQEVIDRIYLDGSKTGLIEQFEGFFRRQDVDLAALEPRDRSMQAIYGIEAANDYQAIKQPDVLMLMFLLGNQYSGDVLQTNYAYYTPRTDHTFGSSLGPSIQAIMACRVGSPEEAYVHFIRAARADLVDVRGNASDGIHAASAGGTWLATVFGFGGLKIDQEGWTLEPRLPKGWKRLAFTFFYHGQLQKVDLRPED